MDEKLKKAIETYKNLSELPPLLDDSPDELYDVWIDAMKDFDIQNESVDFLALCYLDAKSDLSHIADYPELFYQAFRKVEKLDYVLKRDITTALKDVPDDAIINISINKGDIEAPKAFSTFDGPMINNFSQVGFDFTID